MPNELRNSVQASVDDAKARMIELQTIITAGEALLVQFPPEVPPPPPPSPPPSPPVGTLPVAENASFTLTAPTMVRYGVDTRWLQKSLPAGAHVCSNYTFGNDPAVGTIKRCEVAGAPPPPPPPSPPSGSDILDGNGNVDTAKYKAMAAAMGSLGGLSYLFGSASNDIPSLPTCFMPVHRAWPRDDRPGTYQYGELDGNWKEPGDFSSDIGNVAYIPDNPVAKTGALNLGVLNISNCVFGYRPEMSWTTGQDGANGVNAGKLRAAGIAVGSPIAACRTDGRPGWALRAFIADSLGLIYSEGSNTANNNNSIRLPANKKITCIAVSNSNEFLAVGVWDTDAVKGQIAIISMAGLGDGGTVENPNSHPEKGWWGEWIECLPGIANLGNIAFSKILGYIDLPGMVAPTSIQFITGKEGSGSVPVFLTGYMKAGYLATGGGGVASPFVVSPISLESNRSKFFPGGDVYEAIAHQGLILVTSKSEKKMIALDANPLFNYMHEMYFTDRAKFEQTRDVGEGDKWPFTFAKEPKQIPTVIKTFSFTQRPTIVKAYASGPYKNAWVAFENGDLQLYNLGDYPGRGTRNPASIVLKSTMFVGNNPTDLALPKEKAGGNVYPDRSNEVIVTCREDKAIRWVRYNSAGVGSIVRTLQDSRLKDPIAATDTDNHAGESAVLVICDGIGKAIHTYSYGRVQLNNYPGNPIFPLADGSFHYGGEFAVEGVPFNCTSANIPSIIWCSLGAVCAWLLGNIGGLPLLS